MTDPYATLLQRLARLRGARGSLIASLDEGLVIGAHLRVGQRGDLLAAFAANVYRKVSRASSAARLGSTSFLQLDAERGHVCAAGRGELVIVVVADPTANIGLIRVELLEAIESLMKITTVEPWVEAPLQRFVDDSRSRLALLLHPSGQVFAQCGFTREVDVMSACALAAALQASANELGRRLDGMPFRELHHPGADRQLYIAQAETSRGSYILLTVFDAESSIGLVRIFFEELRSELVTNAPALPTALAPVFGANFEYDLNRNLASLFGRTEETPATSSRFHSL